jgi:hypothetical protein
MRTLAASFLALVLLAPAARSTQVRAIALQGDAAPGVPAATFTAFPTSIQFAWNVWAVCDGLGHAAFYANTSTGVNGLWSDRFGSLAPMALVGGVAPWLPGSGTFVVLGQPRLSDVGPAVFLAAANEPSQLNGLWYQDGSGLALAAGDGVTAPYISGTTTFTVPTDPTSTCLSRNARLAIRGGPAANILWSFDPPPSVNRLFCAATSAPVPTGNFSSFGAIDWNNHAQFGLYLVYYNGSIGIGWMGQGFCGALGPVLAVGDLTPPARVDIPAASNILSIAAGSVQPDLNDNDAQVFRAQMVNGGVTSANDELVFLHDATGFHVVLREGDTAPELAGGETLQPFSSPVHPDLVADDGSVIVPARILPSNTHALLLYHRDRTLHVLARDNAPVPGQPGRGFVITLFGNPGETTYAMSRYGQVLVQCATRDSLDPANSNKFQNWIMTTDVSGNMTPVYRSGDTVTVRTGLTGVLRFSLTSTAPFASNGSDGRVKNFTDRGEYVFRGQFTPNGSGTALDGIFGVMGPDLSTTGVAADRAPSVTRLAPVAPNPVTGTATIAFDLARAGRVRLEIYDVAGRRVRMLRDGPLTPGRYADRWSGDDDRGRLLARGAYFVRLRAPDAAVARRLVVLR